MKRIYLIIIAVSLALFVILIIGKFSSIHTASSSAKITSKRTVVIDAGHGGRDAGTIGIDGTNEKDINLEIALKLRDYLEVSGIKTELVREGDYEFYPEGTDTSRSDLYNRLDLVNSVSDSVLISIHQNHFTDEREHGTQIWYSPDNEESKLLADSILSNIKDNLQPDNERVNKESDSSYYILYNAKSPSIMIECGFMSNREENSKLKDNIYQSEIAYSILTGICEEV